MNHAGNAPAASGRTRRDFMKQAGAAAAAAVVVGTRNRVLGNVLGANERIGVGFIGCGGRGRDHMRGLAALREAGERIELVAGCDTYRPRLQERSEEFKLRPCRTAEELLADDGVDAVYISTPDHQHGYQALQAIEAGKDIYCEKPVTHWRQFELSREVARAVEASDRVFMVGAQRMADGAWEPARQLIQDGLIGQPFQAECSYFRLGDFGERGMPIDDPNARPGPDLDWEAFLGDAPPRPFDVSRYFRWRLYMDYAGGPSTDLYPHFLTQVIYMLGVKLPSRVVATGGRLRYQHEEREVPDTFNLLIDYPEGVSLAMWGSQGSDYGGPGMYGEDPAPIIRGYDGSITFRGSEIVYTATRGRSPDDRPDRTYPIPHQYDQSRFNRQFLEAVCSRKQPPSSAELGYHVQTALQMAMMSWQTDKVARFDPEAEHIVLG